MNYFNPSINNNDFSIARWKLLKTCEMNARKTFQCPEMLKMAQNIIIDPLPDESDWNIWLEMMTYGMVHNPALYSYLFLIRGCGTVLKENPQWSQTHDQRLWIYNFIPKIEVNMWPSREMFESSMKDMFQECGTEDIFEAMKSAHEIVNRRKEKEQCMK